MRAWLLAATLSVLCTATHARSGLDASQLAVIFNSDDPSSTQLAQEYAKLRAVPPEQVLGVHLPAVPAMSPNEFAPVREALVARLPTAVQALLLVWSRPFAVGCMSVTTAFAAGYDPAFCEPGCEATEKSPLFDSEGWLPADTIGWWPAMLLPSADADLARRVIANGMRPHGAADDTVYLVRTQDLARNVRALEYAEAQRALTGRVGVRQMNTPVTAPVKDAVGYFTGTAHVDELSQIHFRSGAVADHLTSFGGVLEGGDQMTVLAWLEQGATASYGTVSEPCGYRDKFPDPKVLFEHLLRGDTLIEAYWKSVLMPGQGLFVGEPLARQVSPQGNRDETL